MYNYFYGPQSEQFTFFRIPRCLFKDPAFSTLCAESKILYGMFLDRMNLSAKNGWYDELGRVYIIYAVDEIMSDIGCGKQKALNLIHELETIGLIYKKRQGLGRPNLIYVKNFIASNKEEIVPLTDEEDASQKYENHTSGDEKSAENGSKSDVLEDSGYENHTSENVDISLKQDETEDVKDEDVGKEDGEVVRKSDFKKLENRTSTGTKNQLQEVQESNSSNTYLSETDIRDINNQSFLPSEKGVVFNIPNRDSITKSYKDKLNYDHLLIRYPDDQRLVQEVFEIYIDAITSKAKTITVNRSETPADVVITRLQQLTTEHMDFVLGRLIDNKTQVINTRQYILTALYNSPMVIEFYYQSQAKSDLANKKLNAVYTTSNGGN